MIKAIPPALRPALRTIVDFALPPRCPGCGVVVEADHSFCIDCWQSLRLLGEPCCARCGLSFAHFTDAEEECGACMADPPPFDRLRAAVAYGEVARTVALKLKYARRPGVAKTMASLMTRHLTAIVDPVLVPVPLHRWRIWARGYNQSALIASALGERLGARVEAEWLSRTRSTPSLRGLSRRQRALAVRGAFAVPPGARAGLAGRTIILVDDVYTSGATAAACAKALRKAGAARVDIICWARVAELDGDHTS